MLKKSLNQFFTVFLMIIIGYAINYFFLQPSITQENQRSHEQYDTASFFASSLANQDNVQQALSQFKGKLLIVNFWATWCPPCRDEMPELSKLHESLQAKQVVVLGVAIDELSQVKLFSKTSPVSYPLLLAEDEGMMLSASLGNDKGVLPYTVIIDKDGKVVKSYFGRISEALLLDGLQPYL